MENFKKCCYCNREKPIVEYCKVRCKFFPDGVLNICNSCLDLIIRSTKESERWDKVNKLCQWADVPFIAPEWEKIYKGNDNNWFYNYCKVFNAREFDNVAWQEYNEQYLRLHEADELMDEVPGYKEAKYEKLLKKWGSYSYEQLDQLEDLFNETVMTQNVTTGNQIDQLKKICKTSLLIDERIKAGQPYKDLMDSYEKLIKTADLSPKNTKNSNDFDSIGELFDYLENLGWQNKFYDGLARDEVDETIKNVQNWIRKLCLSESTLTEEILQKIKNLEENDKIAQDAFDYEANEQEALDLLKDEDIEVDV